VSGFLFRPLNDIGPTIFIVNGQGTRRDDLEPDFGAVLAARLAEF
jgi:hypothetical protein